MGKVLVAAVNVTYQVFYYHSDTSALLIFLFLLHAVSPAESAECFLVPTIQTK